MDAPCEPLMPANGIAGGSEGSGSAAAAQTGGFIRRLLPSLGISWWALAGAGIAHAAGVFIAINWTWGGRMPAAEESRVIPVVFAPAFVPTKLPLPGEREHETAPPAPDLTQPAVPQPVVLALPLPPQERPHARRIEPTPSTPRSPPSSADIPADAAPISPVAAVLPLSPPHLPDGRAEAKPVYPLAARRQHIEGRVVLRVEVSPAGSPEIVRVVTSSGHDVLDQAAIAAVTRWRFVPAAEGDRPVAGSLEVPIEFRMAD